MGSLRLGLTTAAVGTAPKHTARLPERRPVGALRPARLWAATEKQRRLVARRAEQQEGEGTPPAAGSSSSSEGESSRPRKERPVDPSVAKGQRTAVITGAISIIFGVIYLGLVQFMDLRGGELLPPPPEAYEQY